MTVVTDILTDPVTNDLLCDKGDFVIGDATFQHQRDLLISAEGEYKQDPIVGAGISEFLDDESPSDMLKKIRIQFTKDGMNVNTMKINEKGKLEIDAPYE
ncbi:MAG: hypothetical protein WCL00_05170 [Bacteroidota bacterium]